MKSILAWKLKKFFSQNIALNWQLADLKILFVCFQKLIIIISSFKKLHGVFDIIRVLNEPGSQEKLMEKKLVKEYGNLSPRVMVHY